MKLSKLTRWVAGLLLVVAAVGAVYLLISPGEGEAPAVAAINDMPRYRAGELEIAIGIDPGTARVGDNALMIELRDADGQPVDNVEVEAFAQIDKEEIDPILSITRKAA